MIIGLVALDQLSKILIKSNLADGKTISIIPKVFKLQYHENSGAVWGIMEGQIIFFIVITCILLGLIVFYYLKIPDIKHFRPIKLIMIFISAGAIGNLIDRIVYKYVIDFLYFELIDFPIFNIADCYVTLSVIAMIFLVLFFYKDEDFNIFSLKKSSNNINNNEDSNE